MKEDTQITNGMELVKSIIKINQIMQVIIQIIKEMEKEKNIIIMVI